jgi:hypothetical protein
MKRRKTVKTKTKKKAVKKTAKKPAKKTAKPKRKTNSRKRVVSKTKKPATFANTMLFMAAVFSVYIFFLVFTSSMVLMAN